jgi:hypothetical protein
MKSDMEIYLEDGDMYIFIFLFIEYKVKINKIVNLL